MQEDQDRQRQSLQDTINELPYTNQTGTGNTEYVNDIPQQDGDIPFEYESIVEQITEALFNGFICFLNPETLEIEQVAGEGVSTLAGTEYAEQNEDMIDEFGLNYTQWDSYVRFEPFSRNDNINRIDQFITNMDDETLKSQLEGLEDKEELIDQFPAILEGTGLTLDWNMYYRNEIEAYVKSQLMDTIRRYKSSDNDIYTEFE